MRMQGKTPKAPLVVVRAAKLPRMVCTHERFAFVRSRAKAAFLWRCFLTLPHLMRDWSHQSGTLAALPDFCCVYYSTVRDKAQPAGEGVGRALATEQPQQAGSFAEKEE